MNSERSERGRKSRMSGSRFERKVRADLEKKGYFVTKFNNNIDLEKGKMVPAKSNRFFARSTGFPDFLIWQLVGFPLGVEAKSNGYLTPVEKKKASWLVKNGVFEKVLIAKKGKKRGEIAYEPSK